MDTQQTTPVDAFSVMLQGMMAPLIDAKLADFKTGYREVHIIADGKRREIKEHTHPVFEKVLNLVAAGANVLLVGPAGCGKTKLASQVAEGLGLEFSAISGSAGMTESQFLGRLLPTGEGGKFEYHQSSFVEAYENGKLFLLDELDAFDPNVLMTLNTALANGSFYNELRSVGGENPHVVKHESSVILGSANTFGHGADAVYVGRNQLDGATLDRWRVVEMDYDRTLEADLASSRIVDWVWKIREAATQSRLRRIISTRMIQKMETDSRAGIPFDESRKDILSGWSKDELAKVGEA